MTAVEFARRPGRLSIAMIGASIFVSVAVSLAMDAALLTSSSSLPAALLLSAVLFNGTVILESVVGAIIEWRRPGHMIGRLLLLSGPLYAFLGAVWLTSDQLKALVDPEVYRMVTLAGSVGSWPGVALIAGWVPLMFPTGTLPGPRWRIPVGILVVASGIGLVAFATRPGPLGDGTGMTSPLAFDGWPTFLQGFVDAIPLELLALIALAMAALVARYRRGDPIERLQIRWFAAAVCLCVIGFAGTLIQVAIRTDNGPLGMTLVAYAGILAMPITIGIAVTRYRLFEIDRIISRTIGWGVVTGLLAALLVAMVVGLQTLLANVTQGQTLAVAASTLVAFALFQPLRKRVQRAVDRRFDRARYDAERTASLFAERLRDQIDLGGLEADLAAVVDSALRPSSTGVWIRGASR